MNKQDFFAINKMLNALLKNTRYKDLVFYSGSCVRDLWLKRDIKDIELTVCSHLGGIVVANYITNKLGCYEAGKNPLIDPKLGIAQFTLEKKFPELKNVVFTTYTSRKEQKYDKDGLTKFLNLGTLREDAHTKDFTINSIYMKIDETLKYLDYTGMSFKDLRTGKIHCTIDPDTSFNEDPLRMLRAIRLSAELGFGIELYTWLGICKNASLILGVSDDRMRPELSKILTSERADEAIRKLYNSGLLTLVFPEVRDLVGVTQGKQHKDDVFEHSLSVMMKMRPTIAYRLAGLYHDIAKPMTRSKDFYGRVNFKNHEKVGSELAKISLGLIGYPENIVNDVCHAISLHMKFKDNKGTPSKHSVRRFVKEAEKGDMNLCLALIDADNNSHSKDFCKPTQVETIKKMIEKDAEKKAESSIILPVNGKDIMKNFKIGKGPRVGKALEILREFAEISPKMTKDEALSIISDAIKRKQI